MLIIIIINNNAHKFKYEMMNDVHMIATLMIYDIYEFRVELKFKNTGYGISRALSVIII